MELAAAVLTTLCWILMLKIIRDKDTRSLSLTATAAFTIAIGLWLIYGIALNDLMLIVSNSISLR